jgi:hypothetical protein
MTISLPEHFKFFLMKISKRLTPAIMLLLLAVILSSTGCVQSPGGNPANPTATTASTVTTTPAGTALPTVTANATPSVEDLKAEATSLAAKFSGELDGNSLAAAFTEGPNSSAYTVVVDQLKAFKASDNRIAYVYTLEQQNGSVRFVADANYGLPDCSEYLSAYPDAPAELKKPVLAPTGAGPYTDSWGTFVSGFAPANTSLNDTRILIGVDFRV